MSGIRLIIPFCLLLVAGLTACSIPLPSNEQIDRAPPPILEALEEQLRRELGNNPSDPEVQLKLARVLLLSGHMEEAELLANQASRKLPFDGRVMETLGEIYLSTGKRFRAITAFARAVEYEPGQISAFVKLASTLFLMGQNAEALKVLEGTIGKEPRYYPAQYQRARILLELKDFPKAAAGIEVALAIRPEEEEALVLQIRIVKGAGRLTQAKFLAEKALEIHPGSPLVNAELVDIHYQRREWNAALARLKQMELDQRLSPEQALLMVEILWEKGDRNQGDILLGRVSRRNPALSAALVMNARRRLGAGDPAGALLLLTQAVEQDPSLADGYYWKAIAHMQLRELSQGDTALALAAKNAPNHPRVRLLQVRRLLDKRQTGRAQGLLEAYLKEFPADGNALLIKSELLALTGRLNEAERVLEELAPGYNDDAIRFARARLAYLRGDFQGVVGETETMISRKNKHWQVLYLHCTALTKLGRYQQALKLLHPSLSDKSAGGGLHRLAGDIHMLAGEGEKAGQILTEGLGLFPRHPLLIEALSRLAIEEGRWERALELLETGIERAGPLRLLYVERLRLVNVMLKRPDKARFYLERYLEESDPLPAERQQPMVNGVLFGTAFPVVGYGIKPPPTPIHLDDYTR